MIMKKILFLLFVSLSAFGQRNGLIDADTTTRPKAGLSALAFSSGQLKIIRNTGNSYGVITSNNTYVNPSWLASIADTATAVRFRCVSLDIDMVTENQQPVFYLELVSESGSTVDARNVTYQDMINACIKNNNPESQHSAIIAKTYAATFCGTKIQKLGVIRNMMAGYGIILKPDNEQ